jgi:hypothetical protein
VGSPSASPAPPSALCPFRCRRCAARLTSSLSHTASRGRFQPMRISHRPPWVLLTRRRVRVRTSERCSWRTRGGGRPRGWLRPPPPALHPAHAPCARPQRRSVARMRARSRWSGPAPAAARARRPRGAAAPCPGTGIDPSGEERLGCRLGSGSRSSSRGAGAHTAGGTPPRGRWRLRILARRRTGRLRRRPRPRPRRGRWRRSSRRRSAELKGLSRCSILPCSGETTLRCDPIPPPDEDERHAKTGRSMNPTFTTAHTIACTLSVITPFTP